jgi:hypothetical protein
MNINDARKAGFPAIMYWKECEYDPASFVVSEYVKPIGQTIRYVRDIIYISDPETDSVQRLLLKNIRIIFKGLITYKEKRGGYEYYYAYTREYEDPNEMIKTAEKHALRGETL